MDASLFDYHLPVERIAQNPVRPRDHSKLLVLHKETGHVEHRFFYEVGDYLRSGDLLVLNDTKVFRAGIRGNRADSGGRIDVLLLHEVGDYQWESLVRPGRKAHVGSLILFGDGRLRCKVVGRTEAGGRVLDFAPTEGYSREFLMEWLRHYGEVPVPPYVKTHVTDDDLYQTVYAEKVGSVAAPTAGFHFTEGLLERLGGTGVLIARITLHVGLGTFRPIKSPTIEEHEMHEECYHVSDEASRLLRETRERGNRIFPVGTTTIRALESSAQSRGMPQPGSGWTSLFISPGHEFRCVDGMITNFHLPRSTLLVLVSAFAGREVVMRAYQEAIEHDYRFFSFGDAMLVM
ncbi:MAG: tRNA preQ1(34) S-adenosylmethionine ribosyltransferase-isomerase QueA [Armatimonadetes bacterium]|nr:tRNA preQ1(34) S-adenosylmethionine ribosyltransferase-isomerase QueA [Armatimonadota bacterium]